LESPLNFLPNPNNFSLILVYNIEGDKSRIAAMWLRHDVAEQVLGEK
jgi:hypothetical protein